MSLIGPVLLAIYMASALIQTPPVYLLVLAFTNWRDARKNEDSYLSPR